MNENFLFLYIIFSFIVSYILLNFALYKIYKIANLKNPLFAFIPFLGALKLFNLANKSMSKAFILFLIALIPFFGQIYVFIYMFKIYFKIFSNFEFGKGGCVLAFFFGLPMMWYIILTKRKFIGEIDKQYLN